MKVVQTFGREPRVRTVDEQLSAQDVAERLHVHLRTVARLRKQYERSDGKDGLGPWWKCGGKITRIAARDVNRFMESRTI